MSISELDKATIYKQNESASSDSTKQENFDNAVDMDLVKKETVTPGALTMDTTQEFLCIDIIENSIEAPTDTNHEIEAKRLRDIAELKSHKISQRNARRKFSIKGLYEHVVGTGKHPGLTTTQYWHHEQPPPQQLQTVSIQHGPTEVQGPVQAQGLLSGKGYPQRQGYPQAQGHTYPQGQGYPQGHSYPPGQGQPQVHAYPQGQGARYPTYDEYPHQSIDPGSRNAFVRLVMSIVFIMLVATATAVALVLMTPGVRSYFRQTHWGLVIPGLILVIGSYYTLVCTACGRVPPCNIVCLFLTVIGMSLIAGQLTSRFRTELILYAVIATAAVVGVCVILACTSFDFTSYYLYIVGVAVAFSVIFMIIAIATAVTGTVMKPLMILLLVVGTLIQVVVLSMELQMVLGGRTIEINETDYAIAAYLIYTSILDIFLKLMSILGIIDSY